MNGKVFVAGLALGIGATVFLSRRELVVDVQSSVADALQSVAPALSAELKPAFAPTPQLVESPQYLALRESLDISTPYGPARLAPGTALWAVRDTGSGVLVKFGGRELLLPPHAFRPEESAVSSVAVHAPVTAAPPAPAPVRSGTVPPEPGSRGASTTASSRHLIIVDGAKSTASACLVQL